MSFKSGFESRERERERESQYNTAGGSECHKLYTAAAVALCIQHAPHPNPRSWTLACGHTARLSFPSFCSRQMSRSLYI